MGKSSTIQPLPFYPRALFDLEDALYQGAAKIRDAKYALELVDAALRLEAAKAPKDDYPNKGARDALLDTLRTGERYMEAQRRVDSCTDAMEQERRQHRRLRREWRIAQIGAQSRIVAHYERLTDAALLPHPIDGVEQEDTADDTTAPLISREDNRDSGPAY